MAHSARTMRQSCARHVRMVGCLVGLVLLGGFFLAGCRPGGQGSTATGSYTANELFGIAALSASNAWTVGWASGRGSSPLIEHWDGRAWSVVPAPGKGDRSVLESVAASTTQDVWAVGDYWQGTAAETLIEHWNGTTWQVISSPNGPGNNSLESVAVVSATDVWAVGGTDPCPEPPALVLRVPDNTLARESRAGRATDCLSLAAPIPTPLIEHWDGRIWSLVASPALDPTATQADLSNVVALGNDTVWATGQVLYQNATPPTSAVLAEQWDGTTWSMVSTVEQGLESKLEPVLVLSSRDIWGASDYPIMEHWNGSAWRVVDGPPTDLSNATVETLAASAPDDLWAGGSDVPAPQHGSQPQVFTLHWNGNIWSLVSCPSPAGDAIHLAASVSLGPDAAWMVGFYEPSDTGRLTLIEQWDGHAWRLAPTPNPGEPAPVGLP